MEVGVLGITATENVSAPPEVVPVGVAAGVTNYDSA